MMIHRDYVVAAKIAVVLIIAAFPWVTPQPWWIDAMFIAGVILVVEGSTK